MNSAMHYRHRISIGSQKDACPFVCHLLPFVCFNYPSSYPLVCKKIPFVGFDDLMRGFTLIEMIVVLTVMGILVGIAAPALSTFVHSNRLVTATNDLVADFSLARNEAIKRSRVTGVCKSSDGTSCTNTGTWASGWIVFADTDDSNGWSAGDEIIRFHEALAKITVTTAADSVLYNRSGGITAGIGAYSICSSAIHQTRDVTLSTTGRSNITSGSC
jgi:type IV fimbrial biogenesis protein FimT